MDYTPMINTMIVMNTLGAMIFVGFVFMLIYMIVTDLEQDEECKRKRERVDWEIQPRKLYRVE